MPFRDASAMAMTADGTRWERGKQTVIDGARALQQDASGSLRGLASMARGALSILRRSPFVLAVTAIAAALLCAAGWLGVIGAALVIGVGITSAVGQKGDDYRRMATVGAMCLTVAAPCAGAIRVGANLAQQHGEAHFVSGWTLFFGVTLVGTFMLLPVLEAAARTAAGVTVSAALAASLVATGRRGLLVTLLLATIATGAVAIVPVLDALTPLELLALHAGSPGFSTSLTVFGAGGALTLVVWMVMAATLAAEQPAERTRSRSAFALVAAAMSLLGIATLAGAALLPAPVGTMHSDDAMWPPVAAGGVSAVLDDHLPGAPLLFVFDGYERRETIPLAPGDRLRGVFQTPDETIAVLVARRDRPVGMIALDGHGRRIDDGPLDRITAHLGWAASATLLTCALMMIAAVLRTRRRARLHRAVRRGRETLLRGHLRALDLPPLEVTDGVARTALWSFESLDGTAWIALPATMPVLGELRAPLVEGAAIELVSPDPIDRLHFRNGRATAPEGAALAIPDAGAIEWLVGTWALGPAGSLLGAASALAIAGMVLTLGGVTDVAPLVLTGADSMAARTESATPEGAERLPLTDSLRAARIADGTTYRGITYVSLTETRITPELRGYIALLGELPDHARVVGLQLLDIEPGSLLDLLGFQSGDVIVSVAGVPVGSTGALSDLRPVLTSTPDLGIRVRRRGTELDLVFRVR